MGHLPETARLVEFKTGQPLFAADLNWNFALAHGWVETAMARQGTPLAAHGELIRQVADLRKQVQALQARLEAVEAGG
jgi:uncharacterized protein YceH (UPF0502 family)